MERPAPTAKAFHAWTDEKTRTKWLSKDFTLRKSTTNKTLRITWADGTDLVVAFYPKDTAKCQLVAQHSKLPDAKAGTKMKKFWADALDRLKQSLEK